MNLGFVARLEGLSDWLSPIVVKEVRQMVRTREFLYSFGLSLVAGIMVAVGGQSAAVGGDPTAGAGVFGWLFGCMTIIGLLIAPLASFASLRSERMERTLDLVMLTTMSSRGIIVGKLLAQTVKLLTIFSGLAPFMAMGYLLGGIDLVTIFVAIAVLFMWSIWACAVAMFFSASVKFKAMSGLIVIAMAGFYLIAIFFLGNMLGPGTFYLVRFGGLANLTGPLILSTVVCAITMINLIFLAENQLALEDEDRTYGLRIGLFVQFVLLALLPILPTLYDYIATSAGWSPLAMSPLSLFGGGAYGRFGSPYGYAPPTSLTAGYPPRVLYSVVSMSSLQLMLEALILMTGALTLTRRARLHDKPSKRFPWITWIFRPGGVRTILYLLLKMGILVGIAFVVEATNIEKLWLLVFLGYILFFAAAPTFLFRTFLPKRVSPIRLRAAVLLTFAAAVIGPALADYLITLPQDTQPSLLRYVFNPVITLSEWQRFENTNAAWAALALGALGLLATGLLILMARRLDRRAMTSMTTTPPIADA